MRVRTSSSSTLRRSTSSVARRSRDSSARRSWASSSSRTRASTSSSMRVRYTLQFHLHPERLPPQDEAPGDDDRREADLREVQRVEGDDDPVLDDRVEQRRHGEERGHEPQVAGARLRGTAGHAVDGVAQEPEGDERERVGHVLEDVRRRLRHDHDGAAHGVHLREPSLLLVEDPAGQDDVDDQREGEAGRQREQEAHRPHVGDEGDEPDDRRRPHDRRREVRPLHDGDVQVDVVDRVQGEHGERARRRRRRRDREGDARAVGRPPAEADEAVRQGREDGDPRRHAHEHLW